MEHFFNSQTLNIAYSSVGVAPINTAEHYFTAAHLGFNAIKGDVRITRDGHLVMCHDAGLTLDENGLIGGFDKTNHIKFVDSDYAYIKSLEYAALADDLGYRAKVCDFDTYIKICKECGKTAYITLRDERPDDVAAEVVRVLRKYRMVNNSIVNSFTYETLCAVRRLCPDIVLSLVTGRNRPLALETVDMMKVKKPAVITLFLCPGDEMPKYWDESEEGLKYADENDIQIFMAIVYKYSEYSESLKRAVQGVQIGRAIMPYTRTDVQFKLTVNDGTVGFSDILGSDRKSADINSDGGIIRVTNIRNNDSGYGFDDALPRLWLRRLPHTLTVSCAENADCRVYFDGDAICVDTKGKDGIYFVNVNI